MGTARTSHERTLLMRDSIALTPGRRALVFTALATLALWGAGCGQQATADKEKSETLTAGTAFVAALQNTIDTGKNKVGARASLRTLEDVRVNEMTVVPSG